MDIKERVSGVLRLLDENYPTEDKCYLHYEHDWQLLIATVLSAQCTDDRVNIVTKELFKKIFYKLCLQKNNYLKFMVRFF